MSNGIGQLTNVKNGMFNLICQHRRDDYPLSLKVWVVGMVGMSLSISLVGFGVMGQQKAHLVRVGWMESYVYERYVLS